MSKIALSGNASGTGTFTIASPNSSTDRTLNLPDAAGTIQVSGNPISGTTGTFTGLVDISAAGAGQIQFPATQNASANANTLDDYEEGTWTPGLFGTTGSAGSYAQSNASGVYIKIGRLVYVWGEVSISNLGSWSSQVRLTLPFLPSSALSTGAVRSQEHSFDGYLVFEWSTESSQARFNVTKTATAQTNLQFNQLSSTGGNYLSFSLVYQTAA